MRTLFRPALDHKHWMRSRARQRIMASRSRNGSAQSRYEILPDGGISMRPGKAIAALAFLWLTIIFSPVAVAVWLVVS